MLKKFIGDRHFYRRVILLMLPILAQNGITQFVNMLDNLMVGRIGQAAMTGVSVANQLIFVFNLCIFGAVSGAGIFGAQFAGKNDENGLRYTLRFKVLVTTAISIIAIVAFSVFDSELITLYLKGEGTAETAALSLKAGISYLKIMLIGLIPAALVQCFASTLREKGQTVPPMVAGIAAVLVNLCLNYVLIFGHFGAPKLGVAGAAIATVISRFVELGVVLVWTLVTRQRNHFVIGLFRSFKVPVPLVKSIVAKGLPLMANETMWATGLAMTGGCYSTIGLDVVAANNIMQTFFNVFSVAFMAVGAAIGIILGQTLGAGKKKEAKETSLKLIAFSIFVSIIVSVVFAVCAEFIPNFYNVPPEVRHMATRLMQICALVMPLDAFAHATYFTLRSGGEAIITIIFDSGFMWAVSVPAAFILTRFTPLGILPVYGICQGLNILKCCVGAYFVKKGKWIKTIVD